MTKKTELLIEKLNAKNLPELQGWKEKQSKLILDNPFIKITDNATYTEGKKRRTALLKGRTSLVNQDKLVAKKLKEFRTQVGIETQILIDITLESEEKQQSEVKKYEAKKEEEKAEKERLKKEQLQRINKLIFSFYENWMTVIDELTFDNYKEQREEFELMCNIDIDVLIDLYGDLVIIYEEKIEILANSFKSKIEWIERNEEQRLESLRLKEEREKFEADQRVELKKREEEQRVENEKRAVKQAEIDAENEKKNKEIEARLKKINAEEERLQKIKDVEIAKEIAEKLAKEKVIFDKNEKARIKKLLPDKKKAQTIIDSLKFEGIYNIKNKEIQDLIGSFGKHVALLINTYTENLNVITK